MSKVRPTPSRQFKDGEFDSLNILENFTGKTVTFSSDVIILGDVTVKGGISGSGVINSDITVQGTITATSDIIINGNLIVNGVVPSDLYVSGSINSAIINTTELNVNGITSLNSDLTISGNSVIENVIITSDLSALQINANNLFVSSDLSVSGTSTLALTSFELVHTSDVNTIPIKPLGYLIYDTNLNNLYISTSSDWYPIGGTALPPPLQSIAGLTTSGNETLYTLGSNVYATTPITAAGRGLISQMSVADQQTALGLVINTNVQAYSSRLANLDTIGGLSSGYIPYTTGTGYSNTPVTSYARSSILTINNASDIKSLISSISGSVTVPSGIVIGTTQNNVTSSTVLIDSLDNVSGINSISINGDLNISGSMGGISSYQRTQLERIGSDISTTQWGYLSSLNQPLNTSDTPTFSGLNANGYSITNLLDPNSEQDAATKHYVDIVASTGAPPLESVVFATNSILPNSPVYSSVDSSLTGNTVGIPLVVDSYSMTIADQGSRILVKDQVDSRQNGIYTLTYYGGLTAWKITRSSDFNQSVTPIIAGSSTFVLLSKRLSNDGSSWALGTTVNNINPLSDTVTWIQTGGVPTYIAGNGISPSDLVAGTISTLVTSNLTYTGGALDLNTVSPTLGGTGLSLSGGNTNQILVTNGISSMNLVPAPLSNIVGTSDSQVLSNKVITNPSNTVRATQLATSSSDVSLSGASPVSGYVLTATGPYAANWQAPPITFLPSRTVFVYQGASNSSPFFSSVSAALVAATSMTPTSSNWVLIEIHPGTYYESTPLNVPQFVTISGLSATQSSVVIRPSAPASSNPVLQLTGNVRITGIVIDGYDSVSNYATIGIYSYIGVSGGLDSLNAVTVRNCSSAGFKIAGDGTQYSRFLICNNCSAQVTTVGFTMTSGYEISNAGVLSGTSNNASGFFVSGMSGMLTNGMYIHDDYSLADIVSMQITTCVYGIVIGGAVSDSQGRYPMLRVNGANLGQIMGVGLYLQAKSVAKVSDFQVEDDTGIYPSQMHILAQNPSLPADPNQLVAMWMNLRKDLIGITGSTLNMIQLVGSNLDQEPGVNKIEFGGEVTIGGIGVPAELRVGNGSGYTIGLNVLVNNSGVYTNVTNAAKYLFTNVYSCDVATTSQIDIISAPSTIDSYTPISGLTRVLVKNGSALNPNDSYGYSIDNGIYVWHGAGNTMYRSTDFASGFNFTDKTWFIVNNGAVNYGSLWKLLGKSGSYNVSNITIDTNTLEMTPWSFNAFGSSPSNGDCLYIGNYLLSQFKGIDLSLSKNLILSSGTSLDCLVWEYYNGSWVTLPLMSLFSGAPYTNYANQTFGYSDTYTFPTIYTYEYRFGDLTDWETTTINGVLGYYIRARLTNVSLITQLPVVAGITLENNVTRFNGNGITMFYGSARPVLVDHIPLSSLSPTGTSGENFPLASRLIYAVSPVTISKVVPNSLFSDGVKTSATFEWTIPYNVDTSIPLLFNITFCKNNSTPSVSANVTFEIDYVVISNNNIISNSADAVASSVTVDIPTSAITYGVSQGSAVLSIVGVTPIGSTLIFKISRLSSDSFNQDINLLDISINYAIWSIGIPYSVVE